MKCPRCHETFVPAKNDTPFDVHKCACCGYVFYFSLTQYVGKFVYRYGSYPLSRISRWRDS